MKRDSYSLKGRRAQEPILSAGKSIIDGASKMIHSAKLLAANPRDPKTYQTYSAESHKVSEAIKKIVMAIRYFFFQRRTIYFYHFDMIDGNCTCRFTLYCIVSVNY